MDLIDRQAAIDAVESMLRRKFGIGGDLAEITLAELPSAQTCDDAVSRQQAIDAIDDANNSLVKDDYTYGVQSGMERAKYVIEALPSVQPQPIVRCKDCKHADDDGVCQNSVGLVIQDDDDFCSRAVRRTDGV